MMLGSVDADVVPLLAEGEIVPPWDLPALQNLAKYKGYDTLPITLRRELIGAGWERLAHDVYLGDVADADGTSWRVLVTLRRRRPALELSLRDADMATFGAVAERGHYVEPLDNGGLIVGTMLGAHDLPALTRGPSRT